MNQAACRWHAARRLPEQTTEAPATIGRLTDGPLLDQEATLTWQPQSFLTARTRIHGVLYSVQGRKSCCPEVQPFFPLLPQGDSPQKGFSVDMTAWVMIPLGVCLGLGLGYLVGLSHGQHLRQETQKKA